MESNDQVKNFSIGALDQELCKPTEHHPYLINNEFVEILQKTQSAHNHLAQSFQTLTEILSRLSQINEVQKEKICQLNQKISTQNEIILKYKNKGKVQNIWKKVTNLKQEPCSLIEIFCNSVKSTSTKSINYQIKKESSTKKHKTEKKLLKPKEKKEKPKKKSKINPKPLKNSLKPKEKDQSNIIQKKDSEAKEVEKKDSMIINLTTTEA
jgi:hypothetical protein